jgi:hypothetical protein
VEFVRGRELPEIAIFCDFFVFLYSPHGILPQATRKTSATGSLQASFDLMRFSSYWMNTWSLRSFLHPFIFFLH